MAYTIEEFSQKVKEKYPAYAGMNDADLVNKIVSVHPEYASQVDLGTSSAGQKPLGEKLGERVGQFVEAVKTPSINFPGESGLRATGAVGGAVGDVIGAGLKALPESVKSAASTIGEKAIGAYEAIAPGVQKGDVAAGAKALSDAYEAFKESHPDAAKNIEAALNTLNLIPAVGGAKVAGETASVATAPAREAIAQGLKKSAQKNVEEILAPTTIKSKGTTEKISGQLAREIPVSSSRESLLQKAQQQTENFGEQIDAYVEAGKLQGGLPKSNILNFLDNQRGDYMVGEKVVEETPVKIIDSLKATIDQFGDTITADDLLQLRRVWDTAVAKSGGFQKTLTEGTELSFKKDITNMIRGELAKSNPDLAVLNKQYTMWKGVEDVLTATTKRKVGQTGALVGGVKEAAGAVIGSAAGGGAGAVIGAMAFKQLDKLVNSTAWNSIAARLKTGLADAISSGDKAGAQNFIEKMNKAVESAKSTTQSLVKDTKGGIGNKSFNQAGTAGKSEGMIKNPSLTSATEGSSVGGMKQPINMDLLSNAVNRMKKNNAGHIGNLGDYFQSQKLQSIFKDVLDRPIYVVDKSLLGKHSLGAYAPEKGAILLPAGSQVAIDKINPTLVEEALHALRDARGRLTKTGARMTNQPVDQKFIQDYLASADEKFADIGKEKILKIITEELKKSN